MAKKNSIGTPYLFIGGTILFSLAWMMPSFPLLAFIGFAPFIAIAVNNRKEKSMWSSLELVLLGLSISLFAGSLFSFDLLVSILAQAILFTISFLGYTFVRKSLGPGVSIITLSVFWLTVEYVLLKWSPFPVNFLADLFYLKPEWTSWNISTGYLGASLWVLMSNTLLYQAVLTEKKVNWTFVVLFAISVAGPITYSYMLSEETTSREQMMQLYSSLPSTDSDYSFKGEFIPRTAAWVSVLILLFTLVKRKTSKR
ncbi:MAG: hypothetical protein RH948_06695 [Cyclobacteriaceae bacterium]